MAIRFSFFFLTLIHKTVYDISIHAPKGLKHQANTRILVSMVDWKLLPDVFLENWQN